MKMFKNIIIVAISLVMIFTTTIALASNEKELVISYNNQKNGFFVSVSNNRDFPSRADLTKNEYIKEVKILLDTAKKYNYNTIYFDAISFGQATFKSKVLPINQSIFRTTRFTKNFDPLEILTEMAKRNGILVVATVDPFSLSNSVQGPFIRENLYVKSKGFTYINYENKQATDILLRSIKELVSHYDINGLILTNLANNNVGNSSVHFENTKNLISSIYKTVKQIDQSLSVGLNVNGDNIIEKLDYEFLKSTTKNSDYFVVDIKRSVQDGYENYIKKWNSVCDEYGKGFFVNNQISKYLSPSSDGHYIDNIPYIHNQIYINTQHKVNGTVLDSYRSIVMNDDYIADDLSIIANNKEIYNQSIENNNYKLNVAVTNNKIDTTDEYYYFIGTSDPALDLFINQELVSDRNRDGYFIYKAELSDGENTFEFFQDNQQAQSVVINKIDKSQSEDINYNPFPKYDEPVHEGGQITLSINAPKNMKVSANFNNTIYKLSQTSYINDSATYTAKIPLEKLGREHLNKNIGNIIYSISDGKTIYNKKSNGKIILIDRKTKVRGIVKNFECNVYSYIGENRYITSTLKEGATDYVDEITGDYVHFSSIGYVKRSDISISGNGTSVINNIINIALSSSPKSDILTVVGTNKSPYKISSTDKAITVKLFNISDMPESLAHLKSQLFDSIVVNVEDKNTAYLTLKLKENKKLLGYDITYDNDNIIIEFIHQPYINPSNIKPLAGFDILIDSGNGETNKYGVSPDGTSVGEINLYMSYILNHRLKALGANVYMSRTKDELLPLYDKIVRASDSKPNLIISIDNDCYSDDIDSKQTFNIKYADKNKITQNFAVNIEKSLRDNFPGINTQIIDADKDIIKSTYCPSLSISFGNVFVPNIYKNIATSYNTYKIMYYISNSIVESFSEI